MMSAGSFISACMTKPTAALRSADIAKAAKDHGIPIAWAVEYLRRELEAR